MVWCSTSGGRIVAHGREGSIRVAAAAWRGAPSGSSPSLPLPVDTRTDGRTTRLAVPGSAVSVQAPASARAATGAVSLEADEALVASGGPVETVLRFDGPARVEPPALADGSGTGMGSAAGTGEPSDPGGGEPSGPRSDARSTPRATVSFDAPTTVTVGFRERTANPPMVTVPPTPAGAATALTHASSALETLGPERSHPDRRGHPPLVAFGERDIPAAVQRATPESGIELRLPPSLTTCALAAPLAFYLGATVRVDEGRSRPRLRAPGAGIDRALPAEDGPFADAVADLLRRVFGLDCLARDRPAERLAGTGLLEQVGLDPGTVRARSPAERLAAYLEAPFERIEAELPAWPLATYVDGGTRAVRCLPHLLDRLSLVYPAAASELDGSSLLRRALDGFYRGPGSALVDGVTGRAAPPANDDGTTRSAGNVATADRLAPELRNARLHGWLADGTPIEAFKTTPTAYWNRLAAQCDREGALDIAVVCNDTDMTGERAVADIYRDRAADLEVDVTVHGSLTRHALADLLQQPCDFVHYIGHCEREGLRCRNGYLDVADLETVRARTFFLNACGSYQQGQRLVERGSVAGAVTLTTVLDRHAATVGTAFARLLIRGVGFERALSLARQQILMGSDYAVVGDGTYALAPAASPAVLHVSESESEDEGGFEVVQEVLSADATGRSHRSPFGRCDRLDGRPARVELSQGETVDLLRDRSLPVCYDGRLHWSTDLAAELAADDA
ncbi:hypothetical protein [Haloglomus salinum]|uniref:hypothetical protein n=1 Tax=Haloglomus salinum TaxID=2962673 RepID=UPI0020C99758|nr:hypothetical protein [Haloglomus salinum]